MDKYLTLSHLEPVDPLPSHTTFYLPHPVFKTSSTTTKGRVVFVGPAPSNSRLSLNHILLKGLKVQPDIFNIIVHFRIHHIATTADIEKISHQVIIKPRDRDLQRILFRNDPTELLKNYRLCTVRYGTKSASFLATRFL